MTKTMKHAFPMFYSDKTWGFGQSKRAPGPIYITNENQTGRIENKMRTLLTTNDQVSES